MSAPWQRREVIGGQTLYLGDCRAILSHLGGFDALITDTPYGVNGGSGTINKKSGKTKYSGAFDDTRENVAQQIVPAVKEALAKCKRAVITPGTPCCFLYPPPDDMGAIYQPATTGMNKWGRETTQPVLFYGKDPRSGITIQPKHIIATRKAEPSIHPCPKPFYIAAWMVERGSLDGETVIDPFMGSGTIIAACQRLGRRGVGIEIDAVYFEEACKKVATVAAQDDFFIQTNPQLQPAPIPDATRSPDNHAQGERA